MTQRVEVTLPKTELSINLPSSHIFQMLLDYFETPRWFSIEFSVSKKTAPSHIEGKWFVSAPTLASLAKLGGNFKVDIIEDEDKTKVKSDVNAGYINIIAGIVFLFGLPFLMIQPSLFMGLMFSGGTVVLFLAGQWRRSKVLHEINEFLSNIPETTEILEKVHEELVIEDEVKYERKAVEIPETLEGFTVNLTAEDAFNKLVDYFGTKSIKKKVPFSHMEGRWAGGPFKIDIVSSDGRSQVKFHFSLLYIYLVALFASIMPFIFLSSGRYPFGLALALMSLITGWRMKRNITGRLKKLLASLAT